MDEELVLPPANWPQCPLPPAHCTPLDTHIHNNKYTFEVEGNKFHLIYDTKLSKLEVFCYDRPILESDSLPRFRDDVSLSTLVSHQCPAPRGSYSSVLSRFNIAALYSLKLKLGRRKQPRSPLLPEHFVGLNISDLEIFGSYRRPIYPEDGFFESLDGVKNLDLFGISLSPLPLSNQLRSVSATSGESNGEWGGCEHLEKLMLAHWKWSQQGAPIRWLANCLRLRQLELQSAKIQVILDNGFTVPSSVRSVVITRCNTGTLSIPPNFLADASNLTHLDVSANNMSKLDSGVLSRVATTLVSLVLDSNPLGDLCKYSLDANVTDSARSGLSLWLPMLEHLSLMGTGVTRICSSWPVDMPALTYLDLSQNSVHTLQYEAIHWLGSRPSELILTDNDVRVIMYHRTNYQNLLKHNCTQSHVTVHITHPLTCDCHTYWFARSFADCPGHVSWLETPKCKSGKLVSEASVDDMICARHGINCSAGCKCFSRENLETTIANCTDSALEHLPAVPRLSHLYAAFNRIDDFNSSDIPETLIFADLKYNSITHLSAETASKLLSMGERQVLLAGNLLLCDCNNKPFLNVLYKHQNQVLDYNLTTCLDETPLTSIDIEDLCALPPPALLLYSLAPVVMLLIASLLAFGLCYYYRHELKVYLYARGCCMFWVHEEELDRDKKYDAFVSFSHADEQFVHESLAAELEREPCGFRLCIHTRDWLLGEWIPTQIAVSVEQSRRTIIVLSRNFLSSIWGRLEFRTAHINAMREGWARVIIILLEEVNDHAELDAELKAYLSSNTYVKWGDPYFWDKLRYALPHRRGERRALRAGEEVARDLHHIMAREALGPGQFADAAPLELRLPAPQMLCIEAPN